MLWKLCWISSTLDNQEKLKASTLPMSVTCNFYFLCFSEVFQVAYDKVSFACRFPLVLVSKRNVYNDNSIYWYFLQHIILHELGADLQNGISGSDLKKKLKIFTDSSQEKNKDNCSVSFLHLGHPLSGLLESDPRDPTSPTPVLYGSKVLRLI